ncbi:hypothetical protein ACFSSF_16900 [Dietzia aerolata]|uniref:hypothetical protein n=1 Tax=Dietzia aerolata TaxID=595984 RepID=UPI0036368F06
MPFSLSMPARAIPGRAGPDLQLTEPGVYPVLVNLNGTPVGGSPARLDDTRTLLPVLEAPGQPGDPGGATTTRPFSPIPSIRSRAHCRRPFR